MARPMAPPPTMATGSDERFMAAWSRMTGSLRWHYPDRFRGYDLSRRTVGTPAKNESVPDGPDAQGVFTREMRRTGTAVWLLVSIVYGPAMPAIRRTVPGFSAASHVGEPCQMP